MEAKLEVLDLTDNYIAELSQLKHLQFFQNLKELSFRQKGNDLKGSNPICDIDNYENTVRMFCRHLTCFDGQGKSTSGNARNGGFGISPVKPFSKNASGTGQGFMAKQLAMHRDMN